MFSIKVIIKVPGAYQVHAIEQWLLISVNFCDMTVFMSIISKKESQAHINLIFLSSQEWFLRLNFMFKSRVGKVHFGVASIIVRTPESCQLCLRDSVLKAVLLKLCSVTQQYDKFLSKNGHNKYPLLSVLLLFLVFNVSLAKKFDNHCLEEWYQESVFKFFGV